MTFRRFAALLTAAAALSLAGCDDFSLKDLIYLPGEGLLSLTAASTTTTRNGEAVALTVTGGTEPYDFEMTELDRSALTPSGSYSFGSVSVQSTGEALYNPGGAIGYVEIIVTDNEGATASVNVTVVPAAPTLTVIRQGPTDIRITWLYSDASVIGSFRLQKSVDEGSFNDFGVYAASSGEAIIDNAAPSGSVYSYRIYAVSGSYTSIPEEQTVS